MVRLCEEPQAHDYWETGLTVEALDALRVGSWDQSRSMCYHCKNKGHIKANCPDRRVADRKPWERAWKARKRKQHQNIGGGIIKKSLQKAPQRAEGTQNLVEIMETRLEEASIEDWSTFVNALKVVKVDKTGGPAPGKKDHARM